MPTSARKTTPQPMPDQDILNIDGAAALLGVSVKTFSKVLRQGDVPGRKVGREWKFSRQALIDWIGSARSEQFFDADDAAAASDAGDEAGEGGDAASAPPAPRARRPAATPPKRVVKPDDGFSVDAL